MKTLKDELAYMADTYNIDKEITYIVKNMRTYYNLRMFEIHIIKPKIKHFAIGTAIPGQTSVFLPSTLTDDEYGNLFISRFSQLGFEKEDITTKRRCNQEYDDYTIQLRW